MSMCSEDVRQEQLSVLVVEDHLSLRELIETLLRDAGYNVMIAASGDEAIRIANENALDLLLTDIALPDLTGDALVQADPGTVEEVSGRIYVRLSSWGAEHRRFESALLAEALHPQIPPCDRITSPGNPAGVGSNAVANTPSSLPV